MSRNLKVIYENGVLRPLEPLNLREHQCVTVIVSDDPGAAVEDEWLDVDCVQRCAAEMDERVSLQVVRDALSKIPGVLTEDFIKERSEG